MRQTAKVRFLKPFPEANVAAGDMFEVSFDISIFDKPDAEHAKALANVMLGLKLGLEPEFRFADDGFEILNM